jgi:hypothetical protein
MRSGNTNIQNCKNVLLFSNSHRELGLNKRAMDMSGFAEHIQAESNTTSALYYLVNADPVPEVVLASVGKNGKNAAGFVEEYEKLPGHVKAKSALILLYENENEGNELFRNYRQLKKPLCVPELCDLLKVERSTLN